MTGKKIIENVEKQIPMVTNKKEASSLPAPKFKAVDGSLWPDVDSRESLDLFHDSLARATGTTNKQLGIRLVSQAVAGCAEVKPENIYSINAATAIMAEIQPRDAFEAMLAVQMLAVHFQACRIYGDIHRAGNIELRDKLNNMSNKLHRTFSAQMETFDRHRRKGQQKVIVQHVNVNEGGQAIVGNVEGGGGKITDGK